MNIGIGNKYIKKLSSSLRAAILLRGIAGSPQAAILLTGISGSRRAAILLTGIAGSLRAAIFGGRRPAAIFGRSTVKGFKGFSEATARSSVPKMIQYGNYEMKNYNFRNNIANCHAQR